MNWKVSGSQDYSRYCKLHSQRVASRLVVVEAGDHRSAGLEEQRLGLLAGPAADNIVDSMQRRPGSRHTPHTDLDRRNTAHTARCNRWGSPLRVHLEFLEVLEWLQRLALEFADCHRHQMEHHSLDGLLAGSQWSRNLGFVEEDSL